MNYRLYIHIKNLPRYLNNSEKYLFKIFENKSVSYLDVLFYTEDGYFNLAENKILFFLKGDKIEMNLKAYTIEEFTHFLEFMRNYTIISFLQYFKPNFKPQPNDYPEIQNIVVI